MFPMAGFEPEYSGIVSKCATTNTTVFFLFTQFERQLPAQTANAKNENCTPLIQASVWQEKNCQISIKIISLEK